MSAQFNNMNELTSYLDAMENRVKTLESQNESLRRYITEMGGDAAKMLPKTGLLSNSFIQRAFTVWGHYFVAQLIISVPIVCVYIILLLTILRQGIPGVPTPKIPAFDLSICLNCPKSRPSSAACAQRCWENRSSPPICSGTAHWSRHLRAYSKNVSRDSRSRIFFAGPNFCRLNYRHYIISFICA